MPSLAVSCLLLISIVLISAATIFIAALWWTSYRIITREGSSLASKVRLVAASIDIPTYLCYIALPIVAWRSEMSAHEARLLRLADPLGPYRAAVRIQRWWRPLCDRRRRRKAEVTIAAYWKGWTARREAHGRLEAVVKLQSAWRCLLAMKEAGDQRRQLLMAEMASKKDDETISHKIEQLSNRKLMWANHTSDAAGQTLSMTAALYDMPLSLDVLLHRIGPGALKERDRYGWTCLHYAVEGTSVRCCEVILSLEMELGVDQSLLQARTSSPTNSSLMTPLDLAERYYTGGDARSRLIAPMLRAYCDKLVQRQGGSEGLTVPSNDDPTLTTTPPDDRSSGITEVDGNQQ